MHTKGMVYHDKPGRINSEIRILRNTIKNWKYILNIFKNYSFIDKAGLFPDHSGIIWYNFFWIRGSFLKQLEPPKKTNEDRYYYETGYILNKNNENNCLNLITYDLTKVSQLEIYKFKFVKNELNYEKYFNWNKYILKYNDIRHFKTLRKCYNHFIIYGINENRVLF